MPYTIEPKSTKEFIQMNTNLPRFQRKQTWKPISNFKLCISIFKNYPIGVVIINKNDDGNWLLDGRQRLNALTQIYSNPVEVYKWAMKFIKFKANSQQDEIESKYWATIKEYLSEKFEEDIYGEKTVNDDDTTPINIEAEEEVQNDIVSVNKTFTFDPNEQKEGLQTLLDLILMVHNIRSGKSNWERTFDFTEYIERLSYYTVSGGKYVFEPAKLMKTIEEIILKEKDNKTKEIVTKETFVNYYLEDRYYIFEEDKKLKFRNEVDKRWNKIEFSIRTIKKIWDILADSRVGIIGISSATDLDAQNIFSLVNSGGTQLTAEELLSAKPYWNVKVENVSDEVKEKVRDLYNKLDVIYSEDVVRWDLCATLISRIDKNGIIFDKKADKDGFAEQTTLGFKLFSAIYTGGISSSQVSQIEKDNPIKWETEFECLVSDLNDVCDHLEEHPYFKVMKRWGQSVMSLTSNTIALEFITIMYKEWLRIGKKRIDCAEIKALRRDAVVLLDKLIYEYSTKIWRGSSDSKLAADILNISERLTEKSSDDWTKLIDDLSGGIVNDQVVTQNLVKPILFHAKCLAQEFPAVPDQDVKYDIDHIYPQTWFKNSKNAEIKYKDSLCNLEVLSSKANESKKDKELNKIFDPSIVDEISKSSWIEYEDFGKYSDFSKLIELIEERKAKFSSIFTNKRNSMINNLK